MRVLMLAACPFPTVQGTQVYIGQMARALVEAGHRVTLVTYGLGAGDLDAHDAAAPYTVRRAAPVPGHTTLASGPSWGRPAADALLVAAAISAAREARFDLIHAHNYEGALAGVLVRAATGLPLLYHAHNLMGDELPTYSDSTAARRLWRGFGLALDRAVPSRADAAIAVSRCAQRRLLDLGVSSVAYHPPAVDYGAPAATLAEGADLIYLGNLDGYQNPGLLMDALQALTRRGVTCDLVTDDARADAMLRARGLHGPVRVWPHGDFESVKPRLEAARVALLPRTVASGFPIKLINYLAAGRPVVACEGGAQGLDEKDGVCAVPDGDAGRFIRATQDILDDPARAARLGQRAAEAARRFGWPAEVQALSKIYEQLLAAGMQRGWAHKRGARAWVRSQSG